MSPGNAPDMSGTDGHSMIADADQQMNGLSHGIDASKSIDVSVLDGALCFQSSAEVNIPFASGASQALGVCDTWWMEDEDRLPLGDFDLNVVERCSRTSPSSDCFDLSGAFANPEGVSDSSFTAWDYESNSPLDELSQVLKKGEEDNVRGPFIENCSTPCESEPRSETFNFRLETDKDETQDLDSILEWVPVNTPPSDHNVDNVCGPYAKRHKSSFRDKKEGVLPSKQDAAMHRILSLGDEGMYNSDSRRFQSILELPAEAEHDLQCRKSSTAEQSSEEGKEVTNEACHETFRMDMQEDAQLRSSACSHSQSCDEQKPECESTGEIRWADGNNDSIGALGPKTTQKPPTTVGISLEHLKDVFHLHRPEAERQLNLKRTTFSNLSRHFGISKWPFRTLRDADKRLRHNDVLVRKPSTSRDKRRKLEVQQRRLRAVKSLMYAEPHQSKDSNTLSVLLTLVAERERSEGKVGSCRF